MNRICLINLFIDLSLTSTSTSQMLPFLLLVAAALPVLGEAQIKKQQNAGKKRGNKIRDQNPLPSCTNHSTSSTSYERSPLFLEIPQNAQLFGHPGTRHRFFFKKKQWNENSVPEYCQRIPVLVTNQGSQASWLILSHQESFPVHPLDSVGTHVELVTGIQPAEVKQIKKS